MFTEPMNDIAALGYFAALASMASFVPPAWKIIRSRHTKDLSGGTYLLTVSAFGLWLIYGILLHQWPLVISNGLCFALSGFILAMIFIPQPQKEEIAETLMGGAGSKKAGDRAPGGQHTPGARCDR
jgi:MtN3 and saliva related transmembrane protein